MTEYIASKTLKDLKISESDWSKAIGSQNRIEAIETEDGKKYWLKKVAPPRGIFRYHLLNFLSKLMRVSLLKAVPQPGGEMALQTEKMRIEALAEQSILVPRIITSGTNWLLIENLGSPVIDEFKYHKKEVSEIRFLFSSCLKAIRELHDKDQYMSQGFVRNILLVDEKKGLFGFIDFEDDPLEVMSLAEAQARDLLLFVNSTARFFVNDSEFFEKQIAFFLEGHKEQVVEHLRYANKKMMWITKLPFEKFLGHDYQKLKTGILALSHIS